MSNATEDIILCQRVCGIVPAARSLELTAPASSAHPPSTQTRMDLTLAMAGSMFFGRVPASFVPLPLFAKLAKEPYTARTHARAKQLQLASGRLAA